jgi:hypothetical protein
LFGIGEKIKSREAIMVEIHPAGYRVELRDGGNFMHFSIVSIKFFNA